VSARRGLLATRPNPGAGSPFLVRFTAAVDLAAGAPPAAVELCFVPGRVLLDPTAFGAYCAHLATLALPGAEDLGVMVRHDVDDALMPRFLRVVVSVPACYGRPAHQVVLEDSEPGWAGEGLRLPPLPPAASD
jgi:hypothetical protein